MKDTLPTYEAETVTELLERLKHVSDFFQEREIFDIYTNSKIYEMVIAEYLGHKIINGHRGTPDAQGGPSQFYEYKHFKRSSSNHSWTFNDFSFNTMERLETYWAVIFAILDDGPAIPRLTSYYWVPAKRVAAYLWEKTPGITNQRSMINISPTQIENGSLSHWARFCQPPEQRLHPALDEAFLAARALERKTGVSGLLTSNKLWELLVAQELDHCLNPEQKAHDAYDQRGYTYEYKISRNEHWTFQDISENVLKKYLGHREIILAVVHKGAFRVQEIYHCRPDAVVALLRAKLEEKGPKGRRQASLGYGDLHRLRNAGAVWSDIRSVWA